VIAIVEQVSRRLVPRKGLAKLLGCPRRRRMRGDRDVADASPIVGEEYQDEQEAVGRRRDHEEIGRHDRADVMPQERAPGLRGRRKRSTNTVLTRREVPRLCRGGRSSLTFSAVGSCWYCPVLT